MKRILIIMAEYFPDNTSNTTCFYPFIEKMVNKGYRVDVITRRTIIEQSEYEMLDNVSVYRIDDVRTMNTRLLNNLVKVKASPVLRLLTKFLAMFMKGLFYIKYCLGAMENRYAGWDIKKLLNLVLLLNSKEAYDSLISVSAPFLTHVAGEKIKDQIHEIKWFMYEFDLVSHNAYLYNAKQQQKLRKMEFNWFRKCDKIFLTPEIYNYYLTMEFNIFKDKFISQNYPNLKEVDTTHFSDEALPLDSHKTHLVYGGALSEKIRNPSYLLKLAMGLGNGYCITLMSGSDLSFLPQYYFEDKSKVRIFPGQKYDIYYNTLLKADVLISLGNAATIQTPGKIFEYMALGKPIIHISAEENDPCIPYFQNYPYILFIQADMNKTEENIRLIESFCNSYKNKKLSFSIVRELLHEWDSEYVTNTFVHYL